MLLVRKSGKAFKVGKSIRLFFLGFQSQGCRILTINVIFSLRVLGWLQKIGED